ncbi:MAG: CCA tRNA nucleotidyltransferase [Clostridia bacterium]|nr:CCA tRNA nucleotidyltransferase [Clostridia bacterium]
MRKILPKNLILLAENAPFPLYVVGGTVRDCLAGLTPKRVDLDICSPTHAEIFANFAASQGFQVKSVFKNTGTVKLQDCENNEYEYSCFRSDKYVRGTHVPVEIYFTDDIELDARRRDFTANAIYYDIKADKFIDPLDGVSAIKEKRFTTVAPAKKVFGEDGLRLMRLARQAATLGFTPDNDCLLGATENAALIDDISPERIYTELLAILYADGKYGNTDGAYQGLQLLEKTGVLTRILPELCLGKGMAQRADFHKYDVLEHSLRAVKYAAPSVRLAALLHDVGKPLCAIRDGNSYNHPTDGERLANTILQRLKAPKKTIEQVCALVRWHMYDMDCKTNENKLRRFFVEHSPILEDLLLLKQADFSACMDDMRQAPTCTRWRKLLAQMKEENVPFTLKELDINGADLLALGIPPTSISTVLRKLLLHTATAPNENKKERLLLLAKGFFNGIQ